MEGAWTDTLRRIPWQVFGTLTYAGRLPSLSVERRRVSDWLRGVASVVGVGDAGDLVWFIRPEQGEQFGRDHLHILFAFLPVSTVTGQFFAPPGCLPQAVIQARKKGFGIVKFRKCVEGDGSLEYLDYPDDGNTYEMLKTGKAREPMLSRRLLQILKRPSLLRFHLGGGSCNLHSLPER